MKQGIHLPIPTGRQVFLHSQESKTPSHEIVTWEVKYCHSKLPSFLIFPLPLYAKHSAKWSGICLCSSGVSCPVWVPIPTPLHLQPPGWWGSVRSQKGLDTVQILLGRNWNIPVTGAAFSTHRTWPCKSYYEENWLHPSQNQHNKNIYMRDVSNLESEDELWSFCNHVSRKFRNKGRKN